jgi:para-nitrobenzyl esterase
MSTSGFHPSLIVTATLVASSLLASCGGKPAPVADDSATRQMPSKHASGTTRVHGLAGTYGNQMWLGVRYAQAPAGDKRFRAPVPHSETSADVTAQAFGSACPQLGHPFGVADARVDEPIGDEDCLFLNVYTPRMTAEEAKAARLPVMVWVHGGGNVVGHAAGFDGGRLAQQERVVVVAINYRLGPLGFFSHPALREGATALDASGNYGLLDVIASLGWVRDRVAGFGGDPGNVTVFGESAGARNVLSLLIAPDARGLFHRAIAQSGMVRRQDREHATRPAAEGGHKNSATEVLVRMLVAEGKAGDETGARATLAKMPSAEVAGLLRSTTPAKLNTAYVKEPDESMPAVPNLISDGVVLPLPHPLEVLGKREARADVPVLLGTNRDENKTFLFGHPGLVRRLTPLYMRLRDAPRYNALAEAMSRSWKVGGADAPAGALAESGGTVFVYRFDWDEQPSVLGANLAEMIGAGHGVEIPFVFGHFDLGARANVIFTEENAPGREQLAQAMMGYWAAFARSGQPGKGGRELPEWAPFGQAQTFMVLDTAAGGGVRPAAGKLAMDDVIAAVDRDERLRDPRERCAVLREVIRWSQLLPSDAYPALEGGACKDFPFDQNPFP